MKIHSNELERFLNEEDAEFIPVQRIRKQKSYDEPVQAEKPSEEPRYRKPSALPARKYPRPNR